MITLNWFNLILLIAISQGIFLILILSFKHLKFHRANKFLVALLSTIVISLFLRIFYTKNLYLSYPHLSELGDFIMFVFGPFLYFYINTLLYDNFKFNYRYTIHFIPLFIFLLAMVFMASVKSDQLIIMSRRGDLDVYYNILISSALVLNGIYLFIILKELKLYKKDFYQQFSVDDKVQYLIVILGVMVTCLTLWVVGFSISLFSVNGIKISNTTYQTAFILLSSLTFIIGVYAINQPQIFRMVMKDRRVKYQDSSLETSDINSIKTKLENILREEKLFLDPKLSLVKLAQAIDENQVNLSRVINESYNKNFYDVINEYRVKEFIFKALTEEYKNYTYLGIALESGFNTKTTFNKAFKKFTNVTPREFFKNADQMIKELEMNED